MSCLFTVNNQGLTLTSSLPTSTDIISCCFWGRINVDRNAASNFLDLHDSNGADFQIITLSDGTTAELTDQFNFSFDLVNMVAGGWYFLAATKSGSTFSGYSSPLNGGQLSASVTSSLTAFTGWSTLFVAGGGTANFLNGNIQCLKIWDGVALDINDYMNEQYSIIPVKRENLYGWWPLLASTDAIIDYSGNKHNLKAGTTASVTFNNPPVSWL